MESRDNFHKAKVFWRISKLLHLLKNRGIFEIKIQVASIGFKEFRSLNHKAEFILQPLPLPLSQVDDIEIEINANDLKIDVMRSGEMVSQSVNTDNCCSHYALTNRYCRSQPRW